MATAAAFVPAAQPTVLSARSPVSGAEPQGAGRGPARFMVWGSGFEVWGSGFGVRGLGFGVWGLGPRRSALSQKGALSVHRLGYSPFTNSPSYGLSYPRLESLLQTVSPKP